MIEEFHTHCPRCNAGRTTRFCPVCGEPLSKNPYLGQTIQQLTSQSEDIGRDIREINDRIRSCKSRHEKELKPLLDSEQTISEKARQIREALDWAKRNDIQHPGVR